MGNVVTCTLTLGRDKVHYHDTLSQVDPKPEDIDQDSLRRDTRNWLAGRFQSNRRESTDENEAKLLGRHLYEAIFRGDIAERFHQRVDEAQGRLRLEIIFGEGAQELARLPWEFLYPNRGNRDDGFLAGEVDRFTLTRFIGKPLGVDKIPAPLERPVRLLLAVCAPGYTTERFEGEEIQELKRLLDDSAALIDVRPLPNPTLKQLQASVKDASMGQGEPWRPDVVHIIGHGQRGAIMVHRDERHISADTAYRLSQRIRDPAPAYEPVAAQTVKDMFTGEHSPKLVVLQTCYGDAVDGEQLYSVAENIVGAGVPAVLAMQYDIQQAVADLFASTFYRHLLVGDPIDVAVGKGRSRLKDVDVSQSSPYRAFGTPVIYLGHDKPLVKNRSKQPADEKADESKVVHGRDCPRLHCHATLSATDRFCGNCGLRFYCPTCHNEYPNPLDSFCRGCGSEVQQHLWPQDAHGRKGAVPEAGAATPPSAGRETKVPEAKEGWSGREPSSLVQGSRVSLRSQLDSWTGPSSRQRQDGGLWGR